MAENYNLSTRSLQAEWQHVQAFDCPAVAHWDNRHFVVISRIKGNHAVIFDPARGAYTVNQEEFLRHSSGIFLLLAPSQKFQRSRERTKTRFRDIIPIHHPLLTNLWRIFLASIMMEVAAILLPMFSQFGIDKITTSGNASLLAVVGAGFIFLVFFNFFINILRGKLVIFLKARLNLEVDSNVYQKLLSLPQKYFDNRHPGDTLSRFYSLRFIQDTLSTSFVATILDGVMVVGTLILMGFYSLPLTGIIIALYLAYLIVRGIWYKYLRNVNEVNLMALAQRQTELVESIRGIQAIKAFGKEDNRLNRWIGKVTTSVNSEAKVGLFTLYYSGSSQLITGIGNVLVIWVGILLILEGKMTIGMLVAFMAFSTQFISKGSSLLDSIITYVTLQVHMSRVGDIIAEESENIPKVPHRPQSDSRIALEVSNVSYRYSAHLPPVFESLSFKVEEGECLAIKGPSGVGKSTLAKLMLGLMTPESGEFRLGGQPYAALGLNHVRHAIGAVMQDDSLFEGSVLDNITFFEDDPDIQWVEECATMAYIHADIEAMPMGYETLMGNMGSAFSGGQKQRVLIARALYKRPRLLLLDEATSHLDSASEREVNKAVESLSLTRIILAHRESTLKLADRILDLSKVAGASVVYNVGKLHSHQR